MRRFGLMASSNGLKLCAICGFSHSGSFESASVGRGSAYIVWKCGQSVNILTPAD